MENVNTHQNTCDQCGKRGLDSVATVFCFECDERKCNGCKGKHSRTRATRRHRLIQINDVPVGVSLSFLKSGKFCPRHKGESVTYVCDIHAELCCGTCVGTVHGECDGVKSIVDAANQEEVKDKVLAAAEKYDTLAVSTTDLLQQHGNRKGYLDEKKEAFKVKLGELKESFNELFKEFENKAVNAADDSHREMIDKIKNIEKELTSIDYITRKLKERLILALDSKDTVKIYLSYNELEKEIKELERLIEKAGDTTSKELSVSDISAMSINIERIFDSSGGVKVPSFAPIEEEREICISTDARKPVLLQTTPSDDKIAFNDCTWVNDEHIVLTDSTFNRLYSFLVPQNTIEEILSFKTLPWCVEAIDSDTVVVTFHAERNMRFIKVIPGEQASVLREIYLFDMCFGVQYVCNESALYIKFTMFGIGSKSAEIRTFSLQGERLGTLELDNEATEMLHRASHFKITRDGKHLIVTCNTHKVHFIGLAEGQLISTYDPILFSPMSVETDNEGYVYVVWNNNSTVHMLSSNGEFIREILTPSDGIALPSKFYFNKMCDRFVILDQFRRKQVKLFGY